MIYVQVLICAHFEEKILSFLWLCKSCPLYKYCDKNKYRFIESYTLFFLKSFNKTNEKYKLYLMCISHNTYHFKAEHYGSKSRLSPTLYVTGGQFPLCIKDPRWSFCRCFLEQLNRPISPITAAQRFPSLGFKTHAISWEWVGESWPQWPFTFSFFFLR